MWKDDRFMCNLNWGSTLIFHDILKSHKIVFIVYISLKNYKIWMLRPCFIPEVACSVLSVGIFSVSSLLRDVFSTAWEHYV